MCATIVVVIIVVLYLVEDVHAGPDYPSAETFMNINY